MIIDLNLDQIINDDQGDSPLDDDSEGSTGDVVGLFPKPSAHRYHFLQAHCKQTMTLTNIK